MTERDRRRQIVEFLRLGRTDDAASALAASRETYPGDGALHHVIGMAFASTGTLSQALEQLESAARLDPHSAQVLTDLAQVRLARGDALHAVEAAEQSLSLSSDLPLTHFVLGRALFAAESARQARRPAAPLPGEHFALTDGRAPDYLRALQEMETALDAAPPFLGAIRGLLSLAYQRAGHYHAAADQLRSRLAEVPPAQEAEQLQDHLRDLESEIIREAYWDRETLTPSDPPDQSSPEAILHLAHSLSLLPEGEQLGPALAVARAAGYEPRDAVVTRLPGEKQNCPQLSDTHLLIAGGLECIIEGRLRFLPFAHLRSIHLGQPRRWRAALVEFASGDQLDLIVPTVYRFSVRSPSDLIQTGGFTQFSYGPGETRYAHAIGARSLISDSGIIPFTEIESILF